MNWPEDFINKIICGDCPEVMKEMPDESIDMAITSPPYWGLRDYGIEQIFGGNGDCEHDFNLIHRRIGDKSGVHGPSSTIGAKKAQHEARKGEATKTCNKCQAWKGQLGLEPTPEMYIEHLTEIFNEVKRVLKKEGTLWLNIGDTYNAGRSGGWAGGKKGFSRPEIAPNQSGVNVDGLQPKCLCMIPERLAWSLIQNGWILRNKNIWHKKNSMPSSVKDRFSNTWEYVYCFVKSNKSVYWTNKKTLQLVIKQPLGIKGLEGLDWEWKEVGVVDKNVFNVRVRDADKERFMQKATEKEKKTYGKSKLKKVSLWTAHDYYFDLDAVREPYTEPLNRWGGDKIGIPKKTKWKSDDEKAKWTMSVREKQSRPYPAGKNPGDVFEINTQPFPETHFAVFPEKLCEKPIKAGCPEEVCKKCKKPIIRETERETINTRPGRNVGKGKSYQDDNPYKSLHDSDKTKFRQKIIYKTTGWTSCNCNAGFEGGIVLDPFAGAGTALFVAKQLRRRFIGIDIKKEYCELAVKRLAQGVL